MKAIIYKIENVKTKQLYIGSTTNYSRRKRQHLDSLKNNNHHSVILQRAFNKHGSDSLIISVIESFEYENKALILEKEQFYIDILKPIYNICKIAGSQLGMKRSESFKKKCSDRMKGKPAWNKGLKTGKQKPETLQKRKESLKGRIVTEHTKKKIIQKVSKPILQLNFKGLMLKEWKSAKQASTELKIPYTTLIRMIDKPNKIYKGFIWKRK